MKKALITGGAGFIGSHLAERLIAEGYGVVVIDNLASGRTENLSSILSHPDFKFVEADICDLATLKPEFEGIDWVFHLAGMADIVPSIEQPTHYYNVNATGTLNVLECAKAVGVARMVYAASSSSYGIPDVYPTPETSPIQPEYPYALTKYIGEELVLHWSKVYGMPAVSLRLFNVFGPRSRTAGAYGAVFGVFLAQKLNGSPYTVVGDGTQTRDFTYVTDVAAAFMMAAESDITGEAMNVGSGGHYSVNQLVELLEGEVVHIPKRPGEPDCTFADVTKIQRLLGWEAEVPFEEGVAKILKYIDNWKDAPVWNPDSIEKATDSWFQCLGDKN
jgi:UDP-glucose 4-epimerase